MTRSDVPSRADALDRRQRRVIVIAVLASFVAFLDGTVVTVALPAIRGELGGGLAGQQWVVNAYLITLGSLILVAGSVSDAFGRILVLRAGLAGFGLTSVIVAAAGSIEILIVARALQGVAGALLVPSSLALIMSSFSGRSQARAIGIWTAATSGAMLVGPLVGGLFVDLASWRLAFLINVVPVAVTFWLLRRLGQRDVRNPGARIDGLGALLSTAGLAGIVWALTEGPNRGWLQLSVLVIGVGGLAALLGFLMRQRVAPQPILPLGLFLVRNFWVGNVATAFVYGALSLNAFVLGVYLQQSAGLSATLAGLASLPVTIIMVVGSSQIGAFAGRWGPRLFMTIGPLTMAAGALLLLTTSERFDYWLQVFPGVVIFGLGLTTTVSPLTSAVLGAVETERSGLASAVNNAVARVAGLIVVASLGVITGGRLDLDGFHRAAVLTAVLLAVGGAVSWLGIQNATPRTPRDERMERNKLLC